MNTIKIMTNTFYIWKHTCGLSLLENNAIFIELLDWEKIWTWKRGGFFASYFNENQLNSYFLN